MLLHQLTCPACKQAIKSMKIEGGQVLCPHCLHRMFTYRKEGENFTPPEFTKLLDTRGKEAAMEARAWFPTGKGTLNRLSTMQAGALIVYMWPFLAKVFQEADK